MRNLHVVGVLAALVSCTQVEPPWEKGDLTNRPPELVVPDNARDIDYRVAAGQDGMTYAAAVPYPAEQFIFEVAEKVASVGYKPLREHPLNPGLPSGHVRGWTHFVDGTRGPNLRVYQWIGDWLGPEGQWLEYALRYEFPDGPKPAANTLQVVITRVANEHVDSVISSAVSDEHARSLQRLTLPATARPVVRGPEAP